MAEKELVEGFGAGICGILVHTGGAGSVSAVSPLEAEVAKLIVQTLTLKVDPAQIQPEEPLFGDGLGLDSIDALELSLAIFQFYGYQIRSDDPEAPTTFASLRSLCQSIEKYRIK
jgi:acyl carrier protein